jgi:predicted  nucleic acid-binding Zn-ribbon protein
MAWFLNYYTCDRCGEDWTDEWSCRCDDDCPNCGARHMSPHDSDDLTHVVEQRGDKFVALRSPDAAEHTPEYFELASFPTQSEAENYLAKNVQPLIHLIDLSKFL